MGLVRQAPPTAKGMVFFTLEDESGFINLVFTPQVYERYCYLINGQGFLCTEGKLQKQNEGHSILVNKVYLPEAAQAHVKKLQRNAKPKKPTLQYQARKYM